MICSRIARVLILLLISTSLLFSQDCDPGTYQVNFNSEEDITISACIDEKANLGRQTVYWQVKNNTDRNIYVSFNKVVKTTCGDILKAEISAYLSPLQLLNAKSFSGSNSFQSIVSVLDCEAGDQLIEEVNYEQLKVDFTDKNPDTGALISRKAAAVLSFLVLGLYLFETPENSIYTGKGLYFALGPQNYVNSIPVYSNSFEKTFTSVQTSYWDPANNTNVTFTDRVYSEKYQTIKDRIGMPVVGFGIETGYFSDFLNISLPINAHAGFFDKGQYGVGYSYSGNVFVGRTKYKFGVATDFQFFKIGKSTKKENSIDNGFNISESYSKQQFAIISHKVGFRLQANMNSKKISELEPWIIDVYLTLSQVNQNKPHIYIIDGNQSLRPGFELAFNWYGKIGAFFKCYFIKAVGSQQYEFEGRPSLGFFQIGIKRDYSWFKSN